MQYTCPSPKPCCASGEMQGFRTFTEGTWVVLETRVPFWVPDIVRHPYKKDPQKGP